MRGFSSRKYLVVGTTLIAGLMAGCATPASVPNDSSARDQSDVAETQATETQATQAQLDERLANIDSREGLSVVQLTDAIRFVPGVNVSSNTFVVSTSDGEVVIDTSRPPASAVHKRLLEADGVSDVKFVIVTHGHGDHMGGIPLWREGGAKVVAHENFNESLDYSNMLTGFYARRSAAQFRFVDSTTMNRDAAMREETVQAPTDDSHLRPDFVFADTLNLEVGETVFELIHTPGETPDHLTVWIPDQKAAFVGDNYYESFPNMYTLRGTRPRWPLEYIASLNRVLSLEPEIVLPSHGQPIVGKENVQAKLGQYRDAIVYVHDAVVAGMNDGKDVHTLMNEISLPPELDVGQGYGKISWSVRGIYESYVGWFGGDPAELFNDGPAGVSDEFVELAGGAEAVAAKATEMLAKGDAQGALQLTSLAIDGAPTNEALLNARIVILEKLVSVSTNRNEIGWLRNGIAQAKRQLGQ